MADIAPLAWLPLTVQLVSDQEGVVTEDPAAHGHTRLVDLVPVDEGTGDRLRRHRSC